MSTLLDPKIMMAIRELSLAAKMTIDGVTNGINRSAVKGPGMEFSQYRSYQPGDDLRSLDWKMFARSDRYYIRESEIETNISISILIDASASMGHQDGVFNKIDYARYLAASLAYLASLQGDALGLYVLEEKAIYALAAKQDFQHLSRVFYQLEQIRPGGSFTAPVHYKVLYAGGRKRQMMVLMTDLYQTQGEIFTLLDTLTSLGHEVLVFHLLSRNELALDYKGYSRFEDLESGVSVQIDQDSMRKTYQQRMQAYLEKTRMELLERGIYYRMMVTDEPLDQALRGFLKQRSKLKV